MRFIKTLLLILLANVAFAQNSLLINLDSLSGSISGVSNASYAKKKSNANVSISDHTFDFKNIVHGPDKYGIRFTGNGKRNLVFKNLKGTDSVQNVKIQWDAILKNSGTAATIKFNNCRDWELRSYTGGQLWGSGNSASQMVYMEGDYNKNWKILGLYINQGRNGAIGTTPGGACVQYSSSFSSNCNASNYYNDYAIYKDLEIVNANDEGIYQSHFTGLAGSGTNNLTPVRTRLVVIIRCSVNGSGRDYYQITSADSVLILNNKGNNGGLEGNGDHVSAVSYNGNNKKGLIQGNTFTNIGQFMFLGTEGVKGGGLVVKGNTYIQGTHAPISGQEGGRNNQAAYLRQDKDVPFTLFMEENNIQAPAALKGGFTADKILLTYRKNTFLLKAGLPEYRVAGSTTPQPVYAPRVKTVPVPVADYDYYDEIYVKTPLTSVKIK